MVTNDSTMDVEHFNRWSRSYERSFMQWLLFDRVQPCRLEQRERDEGDDDERVEDDGRENC